MRNNTIPQQHIIFDGYSRFDAGERCGPSYKKIEVTKTAKSLADLLLFLVKMAIAGNVGDSQCPKSPDLLESIHGNGTYDLHIMVY